MFIRGKPHSLTLHAPILPDQTRWIQNSVSAGTSPVDPGTTQPLSDQHIVVHLPGALGTNSPEN